MIMALTSTVHRSSPPLGPNWGIGHQPPRGAVQGLNGPGQSRRAVLRDGDDRPLRQLPRRPAGQSDLAARRGRCLVAVIDASTLMPTDTTMHDHDDTGLLAQFAPVAILTRRQAATAEEMPRA